MIKQNTRKGKERLRNNKQDSNKVKRKHYKEIKIKLKCS